MQTKSSSKNGMWHEYNIHNPVNILIFYMKKAKECVTLKIGF